ncbi:MAG: Si-specific NAD(P)(+) transhydrogenase [Polyangiaceae bacterium]
MSEQRFDLVVIGGGPAGQKAAVQAAKAGKRVMLIEKGKSVGGACVRFGTIPSKTLRETAQSFGKFHRLTGHVVDVHLPAELQVQSLLSRKESVIASHERYMHAQMQRNGIDFRQGAARFLTPTEVEITALSGAKTRVSSEFFVIATGSSPRTPDDVPVDHEHVFDSDSLLSVSYLPESLTVLGSGVIACEYASIFAVLGSRVTVIDKSPRPLGFLDAELSEHFVRELESDGGRYLGNAKHTNVHFDGLASVVTELASGERVESQKLFCALGRVAQVAGMGLDGIGVKVSARGLVEVDKDFRTAQPHIYAVGDVIGPPALASTSMDQGRRAVCHALGIAPGLAKETTPVGIYTIPELGAVGLSEAEATQRFGGALVGRARFEEVARAQIAAAPNGLLKLVAHPQTGALLGAHAAGEGAADLVHIAQMAIISGLGFEAFTDIIFNFPTYAEAYRIAAFDIIGQRARAAR